MGELTCRTLHAHTFFKNTKAKVRLPGWTETQSFQMKCLRDTTLQHCSKRSQEVLVTGKTTPDVLNIPILNNKSKINSMGIILQNNGRYTSP